MALASTEPSLRLEDHTHSYQPQYVRHNHGDSMGAESFTFDNANGPPQPEGAVSPVIVRAGRIDEHAAAPQGPPELERHSGQDVSPASSMTGSFTADKEDGLSSRAQRKNQELRDLFKLSSDEVRNCHFPIIRTSMQSEPCRQAICTASGLHLRGLRMHHETWKLLPGISKLTVAGGYDDEETSFFEKLCEKPVVA